MRRTLAEAWSRATAAVALLGLLAVAACAQDSDVPATPPAGTAADPAPGLNADDSAAITWRRPVRVLVDFGFSRPEFAAGAGVLVAVAETSTDQPAATTVQASSDGLSWESVSILDGVRLSAVIPQGAGFVAVGASDKRAGRSEPVVATSTDGTQWDLHELETENGGRLTDVSVTATGVVVAVGARTDKRGTARPAVWTSADGRSWEAGPQDQFANVDATLLKVAAAGPAVVSVGHIPTESDSPGPLLGWYSSDALRWERTATRQDWSSVLVGDMTAGSAGAVLVGTPFDASTSPQAWITEDGRRWTSAKLPTLPSTDSSFAIDVAAVEGRYVVVGDDVDFAEDLGPATGRPAIWTSGDARTWGRVPMAELEGQALAKGSDALAVLFHDGRWLVYGTTSSRADAPVTWVLWVGE